MKRMSADAVVVGVPYKATGASIDGGDFAVMIEQDEFRHTIFLFNDNVQDGRAKILVEGGGSAVIRPYAGSDTDHQAVGIPTGWMPGAPFLTLDCQVRQCINHAFALLVAVFCTYDYHRVVFPCDASDRTIIGTGIFRNVGRDVLEFINENIRLLPSRLAKRKCMPLAFLRWSMAWVEYRLVEERERLTQRRSMLAYRNRGIMSNATPSRNAEPLERAASSASALLTTPTGLVQKVQEAGKRQREEPNVVQVPSLY